MTEIPAEIVGSFEAELNGICLTWDHSFGLMPEERREGLRRCFRQIAEHHIYKLILAAEKRGEERERERWGGRPYSILEPKGGWRSKEQFSEVERRKLLPIAETLALLDGNAFFTLGAENEWASQYLPEADAIYQANGGDNGWAGEASFAKPFAAAIRKGSDQ